MDIPLKDIPKGNIVDISKYIANVTIQEEIDHNKKYIREIEEEFKEISIYVKEQIGTKDYLTKQIEVMKQCQKYY